MYTSVRIGVEFNYCKVLLCYISWDPLPNYFFYHFSLVAEKSALQSAAKIHWLTMCESVYSGQWVNKADVKPWLFLSNYLFVVDLWKAGSRLRPPGSPMA